MAYRVGGIDGINKAIESKSVCTIELNSGIQVSGKSSNFISIKEFVNILRNNKSFYYNKRSYLSMLLILIMFRLVIILTTDCGFFINNLNIWC